MKILCKNKYWKLNEEYDINKILYLLIDRPDTINSFNDYIWGSTHNSQFHRNYDLPAFVSKNGYVAWWKNDEFCREI